MATPKNQQYIHGTDPVEQRRLSLMNDLLNEASLRELALRAGERVLDVGSGLGHFSRAMARTAGCPVVCIERSQEQIDEARRLAAASHEEHLCEIRQGDALSFPLRENEWGTFDVAHARFLLEHVPDPPAVVRSMVRAVRPGGRVVLADDDHDVLRLWPEPPGVMSLWQAYIRTYDRLGNDPFVGRRLVSLLHSAGVHNFRNTWIFFGGCSGSPTFSAVVENMAEILMGARNVILSTGSIDSQQFDDSIASLRAWGRHPGAAFWFATSWAEGTLDVR